jgi:hypothetical protein
VPLSSFAADDRSIDKEIHSLVRRLARHGLVDYRLGRPRDGEDLVVIEPQLPDYWPRTRRSAMQTLSSYRGSFTCGGVATR